MRQKEKHQALKVRERSCVIAQAQCPRVKPCVLLGVLQKI